MQLTSKHSVRLCASLVSAFALTACAPPSMNAPMVQGPAIADIVTPFDDALTCLNGRINGGLAFAVGGIPDQTGATQNSTEGTGRFVTQGAGDIVQSALFKTGVTVINRRDMGSAVMESQWGIRELTAQRPAHFVITGSINSLDFLPGGGVFVNIGGVGPRYRQNRILVGMDLAVTNNQTGQIIANISLNKQIYADEFGFMTARFVDSTVVDVDLGLARREAVHHALRQMLQLATFELLTQMMPPERYEECRAMVDERLGVIEGDRTTGEQIRQLQERRQASEEAAAAAAEQAPVEATRATTEASAQDASQEAAPTAVAEAPRRLFGRRAPVDTPAPQTLPDELILTSTRQADRPSAEYLASVSGTDTARSGTGEAIYSDAVGEPAAANSEDASLLASAEPVRRRRLAEENSEW